MNLSFLLMSQVDQDKLAQFANDIKNISWSNILPALITFIVGLLISKLITAIVKRIVKNSPTIDKSLHTFIISGVKVVLNTIVVVVSISALGVNISAIVVVIGVICLAVSAALEGILSNIASGLMILSTKPFEVGDLVEIENAFGIVTNIGLNYTKLRTMDYRQIYIPNKIISSNQVKNTTIDGKVRVDITVRVSYESDEQTVYEALLEAAKNKEHVLDDPKPFAVVINYDINDIEYLLMAYSLPEFYIKTKSAIYRDIRRTFNERNVVFTYPHVVVHSAK